MSAANACVSGVFSLVESLSCTTPAAVVAHVVTQSWGLILPSTTICERRPKLEDRCIRH